LLRAPQSVYGPESFTMSVAVPIRVASTGSTSPPLGERHEDAGGTGGFHGTLPAWRRVLNKVLWWLAVVSWTAIYYATSAGAGIWNKALVDDGAVSPTVLTLLHLIVSLASDVALMRLSKQPMPKFPPDHGRHSTCDIFTAFAPISLFVILR